MKKADVYEMTIKILALYLFATSVLSAIESLISSLLYLVQSKNSSGTDDHTNWSPYLLIAIANLALLTGVAAFLFFKANYIVRKICSPSDFDENAKLFAEPKAIYEIALVISGLLYIIWTLPEFAFRFKNYLEAVKNKYDQNDVNLKYMWLSVAKVFIGVFILLLARQLSGYFGRNKKQTDEQTSN